jgi:hypothetical protein
MQDGKKFLLLDASDAEKLFKKYQSGERRLAPPEKNELDRLDSLMLDIVNNKDLTEDEKVQLYNSTLTKFQSSISYKPVVTKSSDSDQIPKPTKTSYNPLIRIGKPYHKKASELLSFLTQNEELNVSDTGEILVKGELIKGSNITDILNAAVNPRAKISQPTGWDTIQNLLVDLNTPRSLYQPRVVATKKDIGIKGDNSKTFTQKKSRIPVINTQDHLAGWISHDSGVNAKKRKTQR